MGKSTGFGDMSQQRADKELTKVTEGLIGDWQRSWKDCEGLTRVTKGLRGAVDCHRRLTGLIKVTVGLIGRLPEVR